MPNVRHISTSGLFDLLTKKVYHTRHPSRTTRQQGPIKTLTAALKRLIKTVTECTFGHTNKNITNEKTRKVSLFNAIPKNI